MKNATNVTSNPAVEKAPSTPRPTLSATRWTTRSSHPRLVSFSWAAVAPMGTQR